MIEIKKIGIWSMFAFLIACNQNNEQNSTVNKIPITEDLIIGALDQPIQHQLGEPVNVRTDGKGLIYIADRQSLNIKVFNDEGSHLKNISERGRGPGELLDIEFMEWNNDSNLVVMDRGNLRYTIFDKNGDVIDSYPYNNNFYPQSIFL